MVNVEEVNKKLADYTVDTAKKITEFNQTLITEYFRFTYDLAATIPGMDKVFPFSLRK